MGEVHRIQNWARKVARRLGSELSASLRNSRVFTQSWMSRTPNNGPGPETSRNIHEAYVFYRSRLTLIPAAETLTVLTQRRAWSCRYRNGAPEGVTILAPARGCPEVTRSTNCVLRRGPTKVV